MTENKLPVLPAVIGESIHFNGGSSGNPLTITRRGANEFEVRYDLNPGYLAQLVQDGEDSFYLNIASWRACYQGRVGHVAVLLRPHVDVG